MINHIIAVIVLLSSFSADATICNPNCEQPDPKQGEKEVDLRLTNASKDTVVTQLRIQSANVTKSTYSDTPVPIGLYQIAINNNIVDAFCVDPFQPAITSNSKYIESKLDATDFISNGAVKFQMAQRLYDNAYSTLTTASNKVKAGFQVALWEIFYDDNQDTTRGNISQSIVETCTSSLFGICINTTKEIKTDADVLKEANWFLSALTKPEWKITNKYDLTFYKSVCNQDFLVAKLNPPSQIPVPAALPLFISGLVGFGLMRRRKSA